MKNLSPDQFTGTVYIGLLGKAPVIEKADKLVTFSPEFLEATGPRGITKLLRMPDGSWNLRIQGENRVVLYEVVRNQVTGHYYGMRVDGFYMADG